jgi:hypothetical protein
VSSPAGRGAGRRAPGYGIGKLMVRREARKEMLENMAALKRLLEI